MRASDIHQEPMVKKFRLCYRIDGVMHEVKLRSKRLLTVVTAPLKTQSNISIAEQRFPQDGGFQMLVGNKSIDLRGSCLPTNHGESIVMRILDKEGLRLGKSEVDFFNDDNHHG